MGPREIFSFSCCPVKIYNRMHGVYKLGDEFYQTYKESMLEVHVHLHISESLYIYICKKKLWNSEPGKVDYCFSLSESSQVAALITTWTISTYSLSDRVLKHRLPHHLCLPTQPQKDPHYCSWAFFVSSLLHTGIKKEWNV